MFLQRLISCCQKMVMWRYIKHDNFVMFQIISERKVTIGYYPVGVFLVFWSALPQVADFGVSAQLTRTISRRKVQFAILAVFFFLTSRFLTFLLNHIAEVQYHFLLSSYRGLWVTCHMFAGSCIRYCRLEVRSSQSSYANVINVCRHL